MTASTAALGPVGELLTEMIPRAAKVAHRRFSLIEPEDFEQEMWTAAVVRSGHFNRIHVEEENREGILWEELRRIASAYGFDDDRDRRARKAKAAGYQTVDEDFYSRRVVATAIEVLIEAEWEPSTAVEQSTQATDSAGIRSHGGFNENATETYLAVLVDVSAAFRGLKPEHQRTLTDWYSYGDDTDDSDTKWERQRKASSMGLTYQAFEHRKARALDMIIKKLGGSSPWMRRKRVTAASVKP
jgi:hypothetical protein